MRRGLPEYPSCSWMPRSLSAAMAVIVTITPFLSSGAIRAAGQESRRLHLYWIQAYGTGCGSVKQATIPWAPTVRLGSATGSGAAAGTALGGAGAGNENEACTGAQAGHTGR